MCTFLPPPGRGAPRGPPGGAQSAPQMGPPEGGSNNINIYIYGPQTGPKMGPQTGVPEGSPAGSPGGAPGARGPARPGPGNFPRPPRRGPGGPAPGGPRRVSRSPVRGAPLGPIITDPTGDALRMLRAMHRCFPPSIADMAARDRGPCPHLFGVSCQPQANVARDARDQLRCCPISERLCLPPRPWGP